MGEEVLRSLTPAQQVVKIVHEELTGLLGGESPKLDLGGRPPIALMLVGLQGSGKTTTAAKLARRLKGKGRQVYLVPGGRAAPRGHRAAQAPGRGCRRGGASHGDGAESGGHRRGGHGSGLRRGL